MAARATQPHWGTSPWAVDFAPRQAPLPSACDVAVIGGGFTGLSTAYHLARTGQRVAVFEATAVGAGASGRTGGIALEGTADGPRPDADHCLETLRRVVDACRIDCDLQLPGCWELEHQSSPSPATRLWSDEESTLCIARTVPGGVVDPGKLVAGLARAAEASGATIHCPARVEALQPGERIAVDVGGTRVMAGTVVVALNAYTNRLLDLELEFHPALTLAMRTTPLAESTLIAVGLSERLPFYTVDLPYLWGRVTMDRRLVYGAGLVFPADGDVTSVSINHPHATAAFARLEQRLHAFHEGFADARITERWGGPIAFLHRRTPIIARHPQWPRVFVAGAYAGHGVALSVHVGQLLADVITNARHLPDWAAI